MTILFCSATPKLFSTIFPSAGLSSMWLVVSHSLLMSPLLRLRCRLFDMDIQTALIHVDR